MLPKPSTPLPSTKHAHDDDTKSLISVPSLTETGSTVDSISVLGEASTNSSTTQIPISSIDTRLPSCKSESRLELIESHYNSTSKWRWNCCNCNCQNLSYNYDISCPGCGHQRDASCGVWALGTAKLRTFLADKNGPWSLRSSGQPALQTALEHDPQQAVIRDDGNLTFGNDDNAVVASYNLFRVIIINKLNGIQYAYAAEYEGERCYISKELLRPYNIDPEVDRVRITWQKFGEFNLTHTRFEILNKDRIGGKADLVLGRSYEKQRPNIGEVLQYARELDLTHPTYRTYPVHSLDAEIISSRQRPRTKNNTTHHEVSKLNSPSTTPPLQDIESSYDEVTEGECSWASSSDESSTTSRGPVEIRKEEMIGKITSTITRWLRSQFARMLTSAHETTAGSYESRSAPSSGSVQNQKDQVQRAGKRKLSNIESDGGENDDGDTVRPPYPGVDNIKGKGKEIMRFACPYFKYNPTKYRQWPICPGPGWSDVHRVKEHLYRKHRQPTFRCRRCWECFDSEQNYVDHQRALVPCELGEKEPVEGFDTNQERQLRSRKKKSHIVSEIDKWNAVYQILFPHVSPDNIPSPFYENETHTYEALTECQEYILREIPLRLREILVPEFDRDLQIIEQSLQRQAIESTRTIVASLFEEFRKLHQQGTAPTMAPRPNESQDNAGPSSTQAQPFWLDPMEFSSIFSDQQDIEFNFALAPDGNLSLFDDVQLQDIPEAPTEPENSAQKKSDSGYESNNVERPDEQSMD